MQEDKRRIESAKDLTVYKLAYDLAMESSRSQKISGREKYA